MGKTTSENFQRIKQAYGDNAVSRTRVFQWYTTYRDGPENLEVDERSGRPDAIETVRELISN